MNHARNGLGDRGRQVRSNNRSGCATALELPVPVRAACVLLLQAHAYAADLNRDSWDFAVEIHELTALGLTNGDLRWLVYKGYVEHACETTLTGECGRRFQPSRDMIFAKRTCLVLTKSGVEFAAKTCVDSAGKYPYENGILDRTAQPLPSNSPCWDPHRHELRLNDFVVKQFKLPSANQETILAAFQEDGWPPRLDDPLPPQPEQDPKRRLHDTIKSLNRNQKHRLIRFMGDGSGQGVRWEYVKSGGGPNGKLGDPT